MRHLGPGVALGVDLVEYDPDIEPAVLFSMGNALVADSLAKAKDLGYGRGYKVTDREGTLIAVNGSMSGGATRCSPC
jgi:chromosome segregation ATPase